MRILRVADVPDGRTGGMTRFVHCMSDELVAAGHGRHRAAQRPEEPRHRLGEVHDGHGRADADALRLELSHPAAHAE